MQKTEKELMENLIHAAPKILANTIIRQKKIEKKTQKYCPDCNIKLEFDHSSFSSIDKHTQIWLSCNKCNVNWYYCFDENLDPCDKFPWEHCGD